MILLLSTAFAGIMPGEEEIEMICAEEGAECFTVSAEVIDSTCRGVAEGSMGEVISKYSSTLEIIEDIDGLGKTEVILHTTNYDYSALQDQPSCVDSDPGHPIGEKAIYYLRPLEEEGIYTLVMSGSFYLIDGSDGDSEPICDPLPMDDIFDQDSTEADPAEDGDEDITKSGCQMVSPIGFAPMIFSTFVIWGRRRDTLNL